MSILESIWIRLTIIMVLTLGSSGLIMAANKVVVVPLGNSNKVEALEARVAKLEKLLAGVTRSGNELVFSGVNVHVVDGSGDTDGEVNGLGNLIVGYNEERPSDVNDRSGSHNLVVGQNHNYSSYGGFVAGWSNSVLGNYSSVSGGTHNTASGHASSVSGGNNNTASYTSTSVSGGAHNTASDDYASVSGGYGNTASSGASSVSGGHNRSVSGTYDWRAGGYFQTD